MVYASWVRFLVTDHPKLQEPSQFLQRIEYSNSTIVSFAFSENSAAVKHEILSRDDFNRQLRSGTTQLYLIQNLDPGAVELLGDVLKVDQQVFADHLDDSPWYRTGDIDSHFPILPSGQMNASHLRLQVVAAIEMRPQDENSDIEVTDRDSIYSDPSKINVERIAGSLNPLPQERMKRFSAILTRSHATAWFDSKPNKKSCTKGFILLDPPFESDQFVGIPSCPKYRAIGQRLVPGERASTDRRKSYLDSLCGHHFLDFAGNSVGVKPS